MCFSRRHVALNTLCGHTQTFTVRFGRGNYCFSGCTELLGSQALLAVLPLVALCTDLHRQSCTFSPAAIWSFPGSPLEQYNIPLAKAASCCLMSMPSCTVPLLCPADWSPYQGLVALIHTCLKRILQRWGVFNTSQIILLQNNNRENLVR